MATTATDAGGCNGETIGRAEEGRTVLLAAGITSLLLTYRLFDNLKSGPYLNRFSILAVVRVLLYFGFDAECLAWYSLNLSEIRLHCEKAIQSLIPEHQGWVIQEKKARSEKRSA